LRQKAHQVLELAVSNVLCRQQPFPTWFRLRGTVPVAGGMAAARTPFALPVTAGVRAVTSEQQ
jgi:hypothetical protein